MTMRKIANTADKRPRFGDVIPSPAAHAELTWFFNGAECEIDQPSNFCTLLAGGSPNSLKAIEDRVEALHAAGKINDRLKAVSTTYVLMLAGLYTERPWPPKLQRVLRRLTGAVEALPTVRAQYMRSLIGAQTRARSVAQWLEELVEQGGAATVADWRREAEQGCAIAVCAYEGARGKGPSVVPQGDG